MRRFAFVFILFGCLSQEEEFTEGRLETLCDGALPVCSLRAGCLLDSENFTRGRFPGSREVIVHAPVVESQLRVRLLFTEQVYPGTELLVQVHGPGCSTLEQVSLVDVDIFRRAGQDRILDFTLPLHEKGDHLLEVFSDMSAAWLLQVDVDFE